MEYAQGLHAVLAWDKHAKAMGILASRRHARRLPHLADRLHRPSPEPLAPRALETLAFAEHQDTDAHPTFDPIGALLLDLDGPRSRGRARLRLLIGLVERQTPGDRPDRSPPANPGAEDHPADRHRKEVHSIRHGEIPPGTPQPYYEFADDGRTLRVLTPFTPRPYDHAMSNALGHLVSGDEPRVPHLGERQLAAEPDHARLARHRHPRGPARGVLSVRPRHATNGSRRPISP